MLVLLSCSVNELNVPWARGGGGFSIKSHGANKAAVYGESGRGRCYLVLGLFIEPFVPAMLRGHWSVPRGTF